MDEQKKSPISGKLPHIEKPIETRKPTIATEMPSNNKSKPNMFQKDDDVKLRTVLPEAPLIDMVLPDETLTKSAISDTQNIEPIPEKNEEEEKQTSASGKTGKPNRFKILARMIKTNLAWTKELQSKKDDGSAFVVNSHGKNPKDTLVFDLSLFRAKDRSYGGLTTRTRRILMKHPLDRSKEELHVLRVSLTEN